MTNLALFDIDGVLADDTHRVQHALDKQWNEYFFPDTVWQDAPLEQGFHLLWDEYLKEGNLIAFLTGRRADLRWVTLAWINRYWSEYTGAIPFSPSDIIMRPYPDAPKPERPRLAEFKEQQITQRERYYDGITLFDDDPEVVRHVNETFGDNVSAVHCTWYKKNPELVRKALA